MFIFPCCILLMYVYTQHFLIWNEKRPTCTVIEDPILPHLPTYPLSSTITFLEVLCGVVICYEMLILQESYLKFELFWMVFTFVSYVKMVTLFLVPLAAPLEVLPLRDAMLEVMQIKPLEKDLLFSGHTAFIVLCCVQSVEFPYFFACCIPLMAFMLMINKIHYTIDVVLAPFIVYAVSCFCVSFPVLSTVVQIDNWLVRAAGNTLNLLVYAIVHYCS